METHKQIRLLIERLKTAEIDNLSEVQEKIPATFDVIFNALKNNRFWTDITIDIASDMCRFFEFNGSKLDLNNFHKFFKR
jgi:hypothetical protein